MFSTIDSFMRVLILLLGCLSFVSSKAQEKFPRLSKSQMFADYDTLIMALTKINPHDFVRRSVNHYSQTDSIIMLRKSIDTVSSTASFFWLVNKALTYCQDGHTSIISRRAYSAMDSLDRVKWGSSLRDTLIIQEYSKMYRDKINSLKLKLPIKYIDGKYVVLVSFSYGSVQIPANAMLTKCNGMDIHTYINTLTGSAEEMHWDFANKRFYSELFLQSLDNKASDKLELTFEVNGKAVTKKFGLADTVIVKSALKYSQPLVPTVQYFAEGSILYIRMPEVANGDYYISKIDSIAKSTAFKKVVFDVRDNPGGSDPEWQKILTHLISEPIILRRTFCANYYNPRRDRLNTSKKINNFTNKFLSKKNTYQLVSENSDTLTLDKNSLNYKGNIYVLQNENCFSSAGSLISTCQFSNRLINVGNSTGWFAGFGSMPWIMILPHSKILYWVEPLLDFTSVEKPEDLFHNKVKIPIKFTAEDYVKKYTYISDWYSKEYLYKHDKVFKAILDLK
jgi:Peptidase family S41